LRASRQTSIANNEAPSIKAAATTMLIRMLSDASGWRAMASIAEVPIFEIPHAAAPTIIAALNVVPKVPSHDSPATNKIDVNNLMLMF
jgi:hypothetical protein